MRKADQAVTPIGTNALPRLFYLELLATPEDSRIKGFNSAICLSSNARQQTQLRRHMATFQPRVRCGG